MEALYDGMQQVDMPVPDLDDLAKLITKVCPDQPRGAERIGFLEFVNICERCCEELLFCDPTLGPDTELSDENLRQVFESLQPPRLERWLSPQPSERRYVTARELNRILLSSGVPGLSVAQLRRVIAFFDKEGLGRLSYENFADMMRELAEGQLDVYDYESELDAPSLTEADETLREMATTRHFLVDDADLAKLNLGDSRQLSLEPEAQLTDERIKVLFMRSGAFDKPEGIRTAQDALFERFRQKYCQISGGVLPEGYLGAPSGVTDGQRRLLRALQQGDVATIRALMKELDNWNFVYPPAAGTSYEGWCRPPLALLVRPDEGNLTPFLPGVSRAERLALIEEALECGCADANYPRWYWSNPAAHACFEGDVDLLLLLSKYGCDLEQRIEWLLQPRPRFTLVHAAAFNGNIQILKFLKDRVNPSLFTALDGDGSNALHTLLESSRDLPTAEILLQSGLDGFAKNRLGRSPLSMSIEILPELAAKLLETKSRFEYRWWGADLYRYSFDGIVLPCTPDGRALPVVDGTGGTTTIEALIVRHNRKQLLTLPLMMALIERKWQWFASSVYQRRVRLYVLMCLSTFVASAAPDGSPPFMLSALLLSGCWGLFVTKLFSDIASDGPAAFLQSARVQAEWKVRNLLNAVDLAHLTVVPLVPAAKLLVSAGLLPVSVEVELAPLASFLQVTLSLRGLQYFSLYRSLGPLLVTVVSMLSDTLSFVGVYVFVLFGFANAFFLLGGDMSYAEIVETQLLWLLGSIEFDFFHQFEASALLRGVAEGLFWSFTSLSVFIMLNLLIAIFNSTYERVNVDREAEWLWLRLEAMLDFEADTAVPGLDEYYTQLVELNNKRSVNRVESLGDYLQ